MPGMRQDYYLVEFKEFADFSLNIMVYCFMVTDTWNEELRTRTNLNLEILRIAEQLGIAFAFPTQTLHVDSLANLGQSKASHVRKSVPSAKNLWISSTALVPTGDLRKFGFRLSRGYNCGEDFDPESHRLGGAGDG